MNAKLLCALGAVLLVGCPPAPKKSYTPAEIAGVNELDELMRVNAQRADPLFGIRDQGTFDEAEFAAMAQGAPLIEATAMQIEAKFAGQGDFDAGFGDYANKLKDGAKALGAAAESKDAAAAGSALEQMLAACKGCHSDYR